MIQPSRHIPSISPPASLVRNVEKSTTGVATQSMPSVCSTELHTASAIGLWPPSLL